VLPFPDPLQAIDSAEKLGWLNVALIFSVMVLFYMLRRLICRLFADHNKRLREIGELYESTLDTQRSIISRQELRDKLVLVAEGLERITTDVSTQCDMSRCPYIPEIRNNAEVMKHAVEGFVLEAREKRDETKIMVENITVDIRRVSSELLALVRSLIDNITARPGKRNG
jgi:hypothetical protein